MAKGIYVIAEQRDGALRKVSFELVSAARKLADQTSDEVCAILLGSGVESMAAELGKFGADKVFVGDNAALEPYITEAHAQVVAKILKDNDAAIALFGASVQGKDLSARVAAKLAGGLATDCTDVKIDGGKLIAVAELGAASEVAFNTVRRWHRFVPCFPAWKPKGRCPKVEAVTLRKQVLECRRPARLAVNTYLRTWYEGPDEYEF